MGNRRLLLFLALGSGLLTAVLVYAYTASLTKQAKQPAFKMVPVVVARTAIPPRTTIAAAMLELKKLPEAAVLPGSVREPGEVVGAVTRDTVVAGEPLVQDRLWPKGQQPGLTFDIPAGKRAVTVAVNEVIGVGGFVKPGDMVDVLGTFVKEFFGEDGTVTVLQNVQVLAVAQTMKDDGKADAKVSTTITLAVTPEEAQRVTLAEERGKLRIVLRPAGNAEKLKIPRTNALNIQGEKPQPPPSAPRQIIKVLPPPPGVTVEIIRGSQRDTVRVR